jgi:nucleotide-binding universal stress UspA family protein
MYKNILVPVDGSNAANQGLREAIKLARGFGGRIRVVHIVNRSFSVPMDASAELITQLLDQSRSTSENLIAEATKAVSSKGIEVESRLITAAGDQAGECILNEARAWPAELIVCGTHGRRGIRRIVMGSDAEYIVRRSPVPVLLVRDQEG